MLQLCFSLPAGREAGAVPCAVVTVENQATNVHWSLTTNAEGRFYQRYLQPGNSRAL
jgi:hypothetical protein